MARKKWCHSTCAIHDEMSYYFISLTLSHI